MSAPTTEELQAMLANATPGPWMYDRLSGVLQVPDLWIRVSENSYTNVGIVAQEYLQSDEDGELIAAAPYLAAEVIRLREGIEAIIYDHEAEAGVAREQGNRLRERGLRTNGNRLRALLDGTR